MKKKCPICNQKFECKHNDVENCQCSQITLSTKAQEFIAQNYAECLCLNCLQTIEEKINTSII